MISPRSASGASEVEPRHDCGSCNIRYFITKTYRQSTIGPPHAYTRKRGLCETSQSKRALAELAVMPSISDLKDELGSAEDIVRRLVLCFDGTGNKFQANESDTNIVKIYQMLQKNEAGQYHYYQR